MCSLHPEPRFTKITDLRKTLAQRHLRVSANHAHQHCALVPHPSSHHLSPRMLTPSSVVLNLGLWQHKLLIFHLIIDKLPIADVLLLLIRCPDFVTKLATLLSLCMFENASGVQARIEFAVCFGSLGMYEFAIWSGAGPAEFA